MPRPVPAAVATYNAQRIGPFSFAFGASKHVRRLRFAMAHQLIMQKADAEQQTKSKQKQEQPLQHNKQTSSLPVITPAIRFDKKGRVVDNVVAAAQVHPRLRHAVLAPSQSWDHTVPLNMRMIMLRNRVAAAAIAAKRARVRKRSRSSSKIVKPQSSEVSSSVDPLIVADVNSTSQPDQLLCKSVSNVSNETPPIKQPTSQSASRRNNNSRKRKSKVTSIQDNHNTKINDTLPMDASPSSLTSNATSGVPLCESKPTPFATSMDSLAEQDSAIQIPSNFNEPLDESDFVSSIGPLLQYDSPLVNSAILDDFSSIEDPFRFDGSELVSSPLASLDHAMQNTNAPLTTADVSLYDSIAYYLHYDADANAIELFES